MTNTLRKTQNLNLWFQPEISRFEVRDGSHCACQDILELSCCKNTSGWRPWYQERLVLKFLMTRFNENSQLISLEKTLTYTLTISDFLYFGNPCYTRSHSDNLRSGDFFFFFFGGEKKYGVFFFPRQKKNRLIAGYHSDYVRNHTPDCPKPSSARFLHYDCDALLRKF